jgi:hypothetical protein
MFLASVCLAGIPRMCAFELQHLCEPRLVRIANGRIAIRLDPFGMLRTERIMYLALKFRVHGNFSR